MKQVIKQTINDSQFLTLKQNVIDLFYSNTIYLYSLLFGVLKNSFESIELITS